MPITALKTQAGNSLIVCSRKNVKASHMNLSTNATGTLGTAKSDAREPYKRKRKNKKKR